jgi:lysophospholipase L1-like esterase
LVPGITSLLKGIFYLKMKIGSVREMSFRYAALGDSLTVGVGSGLFSPGFVERFQQLAAEKLGTPIYVQVFAHSGFLSNDILELLKDELIKEQIKEANIITITSGGNDMLHAARQFEEDHNEADFNIALKGCMNNYRKLVSGICKLKEYKSVPYIIRLISLYNPFPNNALAKKWVERFNSQLSQLSKGSLIYVARTDLIFRDHEKEYLSIDGIHPNDHGYEKIADCLDLLGYDGLQNV